MRSGRKCTLNYNTGTYASPTWTHMGRVSSPKQTLGRPTSRKVWRESANSKNVTGVKDVGMTFTYIVKSNDVADAVLTALLDSYHNDTVMDLAALDRTAGTGAKGIRGPFVVSQIDRNEDDEDAVSYDVTVVEAEHDTETAFMAASFTIA